MFLHEKSSFRASVYVEFCDFSHGGDTASIFAKNHLMNYIVDQPGFWSVNDEDILQAIKKGFLECHMAMWKDLGKPASFVLNQVDEKIERDFSFRPVASLVSLGSRGSV